MSLAHYLAFGSGSLVAFGFCFLWLLRLERHTLQAVQHTARAARRTGFQQGWQDAMDLCASRAERTTLQHRKTVRSLEIQLQHQKALVERPRPPAPVPAPPAPAVPACPDIPIPRILQKRQLTPWHAGKPSPQSTQWALLLEGSDDAEAENLTAETARYLAALHAHHLAAKTEAPRRNPRPTPVSPPSAPISGLSLPPVG